MRTKRTGFGNKTVIEMGTDVRSKLTPPSAPLLHEIKHWQSVASMNVIQHQQHPL